MPYLTQAELETRVGGVDPLRELTDDDEDGAPDSAVVALVLTGLDSEFDFYFRAGGYTVPLTDAAAITGLKYAMLNIANYRLKSRGDRDPSDADKTAYDEAVAFFQMVAARKILLVTVSAIDSAYPVLVSDDIIFDRETLATY